MEAEDHEFEVSVGYTARHCLKTKISKHTDKKSLKEL
jgi:hypothetical protein